MKDGFLRVGAASPKIRVADIDFNAEQIISCVKNADKDCALLVFPELCVTGCTCGDLFRQEAFIDHAWEALYRIAEETSDAPQVFIIGLPAYIEGKLLNLAVVLHEGILLGCNVKLTLSEEQSRYFSPYEIDGSFYDEYFDEEISFGQPLYFSDNDLFSFGVIFDEDLRAPISDDVDMALAGCQIIATLSSRPYIVGATEKTSSLLSAQSRKLHAAYIYANVIHSMPRIVLINKFYHIFKAFSITEKDFSKSAPSKWVMLLEENLETLLSMSIAFVRTNTELAESKPLYKQKRARVKGNKFFYSCSVRFCR